jgi:hypothetical protein
VEADSGDQLRPWAGEVRVFWLRLLEGGVCGDDGFHL